MSNPTLTPPLLPMPMPMPMRTDAEAAHNGGDYLVVRGFRDVAKEAMNVLRVGDVVKYINGVRMRSTQNVKDLLVSVVSGCLHSAFLVWYLHFGLAVAVAFALAFAPLHLHLCICTFAFEFAFEFVFSFALAFAPLHLHLCICTFAFAFAFAFPPLHLHLCVCICICTCTFSISKASTFLTPLSVCHFPISVLQLLLLIDIDRKDSRRNRQKLSA